MHKHLPGLEEGEGNLGRRNSMAKTGCMEFWNSEFSQCEIHSEWGRCEGTELVDEKQADKIVGLYCEGCIILTRGVCAPYDQFT